jgi:prolyl-tRNA synthetase
MGIPYRLVISTNTLAKQVYELKKRQEAETRLVNQETLMKELAA